MADIKPEANTMPPHKDDTLTLPEGRVISYMACGDTEGKHTVLFFHPVIGNRCEAADACRDAMQRLGPLACIPCELIE